MTSFSTTPYIDSSFWAMCWYGHEPISTPFLNYNCINGLICDGSPHINPIDDIITKYPFSGNPVDSTGWNMGYQNLIAPGIVEYVFEFWSDNNGARLYTGSCSCYYCCPWSQVIYKVYSVKEYC